MSNDGNNGAIPETPEVPPEAQMAAAQMIGALVQGFASDLPEERVLQIAMGELTQQASLGNVLTDAVDPQKRTTHSRFGFHVRDLRTNEIMATIEAPKDLHKATSLNELKHAVDVIAFTTSPAARSVLRSFGYAVEFFQKKTPLVSA